MLVAWLDDKVWCHPKLTDLSDRAFRAYINGIAYSSGFTTRGHLSPGQQTTIGVTAKARQELLDAGLWEVNGNGVYIHDWEIHNGAHDQRRIRERLRKAAYREQMSRGQGVGQDVGQSTGQEVGQDADIEWDK